MTRRPPGPRVVIFDAFNTLVRPVPGFENTFTAVTRLGVADPTSVMAMLQSESDGLDHRQWSSREEYSN